MSGKKDGFNGLWVLNPVFDYVDDFSEDLARVKSEGKYGFVDRCGRIVVEPVFDEAISFSGGFSQVSKGGKWGIRGQERTACCEAHIR